MIGFNAGVRMALTIVLELLDEMEAKQRNATQERIEAVRDVCSSLRKEVSKELAVIK